MRYANGCSAIVFVAGIEMATCESASTRGCNAPHVVEVSSWGCSVIRDQRIERRQAIRDVHVEQLLLEPEV
jgi:hypothetical protein